MIRNKGRTCLIDGCDRAAHCHGWCVLHYKRWTHTGDPETTLITPKGERLVTLLRLMEIETDDCVLWPYTSTANGYGVVTINNRSVAAHRYVCTQRHGPKPNPQMHAAHRCGHRLCVNPRHIRWATPVENAADKLIHGTHLAGDRHPRSKISEADRAEIRRLARSGVSLSELSRRFDISRGSIRHWKVPK